MKRHLLDTSLLVALLYDRPAAVELITPWLIRQEVATSILVYGEVVEHIKGRPRFAFHRSQLRELLEGITPYFLTYATLEHYADIRRALRPPYGPGLIGDIDTLIAATALERSLTVVTMDRDFERVPGLQVRLLAREALRARRR